MEREKLEGEGGGRQGGRKVALALCVSAQGWCPGPWKAGVLVCRLGGTGLCTWAKGACSHEHNCSSVSLTLQFCLDWQLHPAVVPQVTPPGKCTP